ncbi:MerR family transcriptional regulator [Streptomyces sp. AJS327]|uniref:MerR family transcriptional regulator n=1 Tax=Streptomyces sp. AJS327 TaxID=2545265 RepID=UPI0015DE6DB5|nr:MerR family transcriptional regulator [Streptomyces sp. AJS327]MBA0052243.1 MerR family transcriptional regulator [Streptomyces sp. AJS327]
MRIGELAALAGVTTRTVRHYHRIGLLPEPERRSNGYRVYGLRGAIELVRIRRLTELGLGLDEIRDVLADDQGRDTHEVLAELDEDLARQERSVRERRERLAELLRNADASGGLPPEGPVSPELTALFTEMSEYSARLPGAEPHMAARDREVLALLDAAPESASYAWLTELLASLRADSEAMRAAYDIYARLDELAGAPVDDPRIPEVAAAIAALMPDELAPELARSAVEMDEGVPGGAFAEALLAHHTPAQAEVLRRTMRLLWERAR